jgi:dihydroorotase
MVDALQVGDILAQPFSPHPCEFVVENGKLRSLVYEVVARGLKIDVHAGLTLQLQDSADRIGQWSDSGYAQTCTAIRRTFPHLPARPTAIPTANIRFCQFSIVSAMTTMLTVGLQLDHIVAAATRNAAKLLGMDDTIGALNVSGVAAKSIL